LDSINIPPKETTVTASYSSFLDIFLRFNISDHLSPRLYDKTDDFNFAIINYHTLIVIYRLYFGTILMVGHFLSPFSSTIKTFKHLSLFLNWFQEHVDLKTKSAAVVGVV